VVVIVRSPAAPSAPSRPRSATRRSIPARTSRGDAQAARSATCSPPPIFVGAGAFPTLSTVMFLRWPGLPWTWALPGVLLGSLLWPFDQTAAAFAAITALPPTTTGVRWHFDDLRHGADRARDARDRRTPVDAGCERIQRRRRAGRAVDRPPRTSRSGANQRGRTVRMPVGTTSGRRALVVGATGSGKTVTQAFIAGRLIRTGHGAVVIGPKGDRLLRDELSTPPAKPAASSAPEEPENGVAGPPRISAATTNLLARGTS
jgi:hypothetical protein